MEIKKEICQVELPEYGIKVNKYLTYAQIQGIVNSVVQLKQTEKETKGETKTYYDSWAEINQNIDMLVLLFATNLEPEQLQNFNHTDFLQNGLIQAVKDNIENYWQIEEAIEYTESWKRMLVKYASVIPQMLQKVKDNGNVAE